MSAWSWPATIALPASTSKWETNIFHNSADDAGEATYRLLTGEQFQIQARASGRNFNLEVLLDGIATQGNTQGNTISLGWEKAVT